MREDATSSAAKSQLVTEICSLPTLTIACIHRDFPCLSSPASQFIDWYRLLGVEENSGFDDIKRKYHRLALQLHPDKNCHPKADTAFKLLLQGYSVLSDSAKRRDFDCERRKCFCIDCNRIPYSAPKVNECCPKVNRIRQALKDMRERFKEEARVMEHCLKVNNVSASSSSSKDSSLLFRCRSRRESPVFDPCNYGGEGYPHFRERWSFDKNNVRKQSFSNGQRSRAFENRVDREMLKSKRLDLSHVMIDDLNS